MVLNSIVFSSLKNKTSEEITQDRNTKNSLERMNNHILMLEGTIKTVLLKINFTINLSKTNISSSEKTRKKIIKEIRKQFKAGISDAL